jgi:hypothetical protein
VNESQKRQIFAALGLGALILLAVKAPQEYATFALVASLVGGAALILWVSSGTGGADSELLFLAIRKAQEGERIDIPAGADASTRRLLEEVDRLSKAHVTSGEATKLLRQEVSQSTKFARPCFAASEVERRDHSVCHRNDLRIDEALGAC